MGNSIKGMAAEATRPLMRRKKNKRCSSRCCGSGAACDISAERIRRRAGRHSCCRLCRCRREAGDEEDSGGSGGGSAPFSHRHRQRSSIISFPRRLCSASAVFLFLLLLLQPVLSFFSLCGTYQRSSRRIRGVHRIADASLLPFAVGPATADVGRTARMRIDATSSSDLKKVRQRKKPAKNTRKQRGAGGTGANRFSEEGVVRRLKKAAVRASAASRGKADAGSAFANNRQVGVVANREVNFAAAGASPGDHNRAAVDHLPSLHELTRVIDQQLHRGRMAASNQNPMLVQPPPDSMSSLFGHNQQQEHAPPKSLLKAAFSVGGRGSRGTSTTTATKHVAILLAKPLQDDQITVEGAERVRLLVRLMVAARRKQQQPKLPPSPETEGSTLQQPFDLVCFVGGTTGDNCVSDADAAYLYFRSLCGSQKLPIQVPIHLERRHFDHTSLQSIVQLIQQKYLQDWSRDIATAQPHQPHQNQQQVSPGGGKTAMMKSSSQQHKKKDKLQIKFSLVSSEYQLCQLNDIHARSPKQSALKAFASLEKIESIEVLWSFKYTTTATAYNNSPLRAFCAKTYKTAQQLVPVLYNLRGVVRKDEFLQRDNYKVLVAARRSLVSDAESMYGCQPSLQAVHHSLRSTNTEGNCSANKPLDVVLESALLSLGRCLDLIRPAGLLTGSVAFEDFKRALTSLQQAYYLLDRACDPDVPLAEAWGSLGSPDLEEADGEREEFDEDYEEDDDDDAEKEVTLCDLLQ